MAATHLWAFMAFLSCGQRRRVVDMARISKEQANRWAEVTADIYATFLDSNMALIDVKLEKAMDLVEHTIELSRDTETEQAHFVSAMLIGLRLVIYLGDTDEYRGRTLWKVVPE